MFQMMELTWRTPLSPWIRLPLAARVRGVGRRGRSQDDLHTTTSCSAYSSLRRRGGSYVHTLTVMSLGRQNHHTVSSAYKELINSKYWGMKISSLKAKVPYKWVPYKRTSYCFSVFLKEAAVCKRIKIGTFWIKGGHSIASA